VTLLADQPVVLASGSATRAAMLRAAGLEIVVAPAAVDEDEVKRALRADGATAADAAEFLAEMKAQRVSARHPGALVVGADQMLECEGAWFDKPADRAGAKAHLSALSGRTHRLVSAAVVCVNGARTWHAVDAAELTMRRLSETFVDRYLDAAGEAVTTSVGAYQLEGLGAQLFSRVRGDHWTILGLPLLPLLAYLRERAVLPG
jgi:septum formation protein